MWKDGAWQTAIAATTRVYDRACLDGTVLSVIDTVEQTPPDEPQLLMSRQGRSRGHERGEEPLIQLSVEASYQLKSKS